MSGRLWVPNAERANGPHHAGLSMVGGPPRVVHHITWDRLDPRPSYDGVRNFLVAAGHEPTLMVDPLTGRITQFVPASRAAYALRNVKGGVQTNRMGTVCIQVEWFFSPGLTVTDAKGRRTRYDDLTETPLRGLEEVLQLAESWGVPLVWPAGKPLWVRNRKDQPRRDVRVWETEAGHYGHVHVPENDHQDPGPMSLTRRLPPAPSVPQQPSRPPADPTPPPLVKGPATVIIVLHPDGSRQFLCDRTGATHISLDERAVLVAGGVPYVDAADATAVQRAAFLAARGVL